MQTLGLGGGCTLSLKDPLVSLVTMTNANGSASVGIPISADTSLLGTTVYAQAFVFDPMGAFAGAAFTGGLKLVVGD